MKELGWESVPTTDKMCTELSISTRRPSRKQLCIIFF